MTKEEFLKKLKDECEFLSIDLTNETYLCECGSPDVDQQHWVGVNTGLIAELVDEQLWYCNVCQEEKPTCYQYDEFMEEKMYEKI